MKKIKTILITGANGRIGSVLTKFVLEKGNNVILIDKDFSKVRKILTKFNNKKYLLSKIDVNNFKKLNLTLNSGILKFNSIDAAIYCAYPTTKKWGKTKFEEKKFLDISENLKLQLAGPIIFSQKILNIFNKQKKGNLILFSSIMGIQPPKFEIYKGTKLNSSIEYGAIKSGIISITKYLAKLYKNRNIKINCISPGGIFDNQPKKFVKQYRKVCNSKGLLSAADLIPAFKYLLDEDNTVTTGQNIIVDDGWSI